MKSSSIKLGVILIGVIIFGYTEVWGEEWKYVAQSSEGIFSYDVTSIARSSLQKLPVRFSPKGLEKNPHIL